MLVNWYGDSSHEVDRSVYKVKAPNQRGGIRIRATEASAHGFLPQGGTWLSKRDHFM